MAPVSALVRGHRARHATLIRREEQAAAEAEAEEAEAVRKKLAESREKRVRRQTSRRLSRRGVGAAALPCDLLLHDSRSYRSKLRGQGRLHTGRVERVRKTLPAKPSVQALKAVTGDWSSAAAAAHFFSKAKGGDGDVNWEAWNRELSWRCEVEAGPAMVATGRNAAALAAGRSAVSV